MKGDTFAQQHAELSKRALQHLRYHCQVHSMSFWSVINRMGGLHSHSFSLSLLKILNARYVTLNKLCFCWENKPTPKRFWNMRHLFPAQDIKIAYETDWLARCKFLLNYITSHRLMNCIDLVIVDALLQRGHFKSRCTVLIKNFKCAWCSPFTSITQVKI